MNQAEIYDKMVEESKTKHTYIYTGETLKLLDRIIPKKGKILDLGCGTGHIAQALSDREWYGTDISPKSIEVAKRFYKKAVVGDITKRIPFKDNSFDYVISISTLHHVPFKLKETLQEVKRVLKNDGQLIAIEHDSRHLAACVVHNSIFKVVPCSDERTLHPDQVGQILKDVGFSEITFEPIEIQANQQALIAPFVIRVIKAIPVTIAYQLSRGSFSFLLMAKVNKNKGNIK